jgi:TIR domain
MLVKLAKEVAKVLRPEPQASIGFGLIQSTYYDEKTGKLMAKVVPDPSRPGKVSLTFQPGGASSERRMKYDAALSFAGEDRHYAEELKTIVKNAGFEIFYDNDEESELWGENVYDVLYDVYANQSRFVVMFVSEHYARKEWTTHERQAAQSTALKKKGKAYILPVYIDNTQLPGLHGTIGRQDIKKGIPHIAKMLIEKLKKSPT